MRNLTVEKSCILAGVRLCQTLEISVLLILIIALKRLLTKSVRKLPEILL